MTAQRAGDIAGEHNVGAVGQIAAGVVGQRILQRTEQVRTVRRSQMVHRAAYES